VNPDGDAIGSVAAFARIAQHLGADVRLLLVSGLPDFLSWLPLPCPWVRTVAELGDWVPDMVAVLDCGEAGRTGPELTAFLNGTGLPAAGWKDADTVNIDHHLHNPCFATHNWTDHTRSATGELVGLLAERAGLELGGDLGQAVYLTLVSDTGNFSFSNTSADTFAMAARIIGAGLNVGDFSSRYENTWTIARMHLWGRLFSEVTLHADGAVACCAVPKSYLDELGLKKADVDGFAAWLRRLRGTRVGLFVREDAPSHCKISLRSMGDVDVRAVAAHFGGGGHAAAAGAEIFLPPDEVVRVVLAELEKALG
jgi:phosphoesterase RecJ-like protein